MNKRIIIEYKNKDLEFLLFGESWLSISSAMYVIEVINSKKKDFINRYLILWIFIVIKYLYLIIEKILIKKIEN